MTFWRWIVIYYFFQPAGLISFGGNIKRPLVYFSSQIRRSKPSTCNGSTNEISNNLIHLIRTFTKEIYSKQTMHISQTSMQLWCAKNNLLSSSLMRLIGIICESTTFICVCIIQRRSGAGAPEAIPLPVKCICVAQISFASSKSSLRSVDVFDRRVNLPQNQMVVASTMKRFI